MSSLIFFSLTHRGSIKMNLLKQLVSELNDFTIDLGKIEWAKLNIDNDKIVEDREGYGLYHEITSIRLCTLKDGFNGQVDLQKFLQVLIKLDKDLYSLNTDTIFMFKDCWVVMSEVKDHGASYNVPKVIRKPSFYTKFTKINQEDAMLCTIRDCILKTELVTYVQDLTVYYKLECNLFNLVFTNKNGKLSIVEEKLVSKGKYDKHTLIKVFNTDLVTRSLLATIHME